MGGQAARLPTEVFERHELEALRRQEPQVLEKFYRLFFDRIHGYVRRLVLDDHLAEDLTQDIFLHIHSALPSFDPARPLRPWVFTIATNKVRDLWSSRGFRESRRELGMDEDGGVLHPVAREGKSSGSLRRAGSADGPLEALEQRELNAALTQALDEVPETMRSTLWLRAFEGLSFRDIAAMFDRSEIAVRKRYSRGLRELRERLELLLGGDQDS